MFGWNSFDLKIGNIEKKIHKSARAGKKMHFALIDPDMRKLSTEQISQRCKKLGEWGTDAVLVGGSTHFRRNDVDATIEAIRSACSIPIVLYPSKPGALSEKADGILFMSLLNSRDPWWISEAQTKAAAWVKNSGLEVMPMAYLIVSPGMTVGRVGKAKLIKHKEISRAVGYAIAAQLFGFRIVYLEAGSGASKPVPVEMVRAVKNSLDVPLIVGGGIRDAQTARERLEAGADIIVTGTAIENDIQKHEAVVRAIKGF
ncbi:MAG: geranylgeranylglyceryl/heptaprenylglyceryl phosphate synthase [Candidatus Aenigmarchaeota archaeon]|nr:geranylgeranylglyceryl/heptaprenylglyceryl phosphate synthase [Candidatus Aenigmarchaeota archaeon]